MVEVEVLEKAEEVLPAPSREPEFVGDEDEKSDDNFDDVSRK